MARGLVIAVVLGLAAVVAAPAAAAREPDTIEVAFVRGGKIVRVERVVPTGVDPTRHALRELVQGPTRAERAEGIKTAIRPGVRLRSVRADGDVLVASFSRSLLGPATAPTIRTRFTQIAATLAPLGEQRHALIAAEGRLANVLALGMRPHEWAPERGEKGYHFSARAVQMRLFMLGYLERSAVTGELDYATSQALLAFQGWEDIDRTGTVTGRTQVELLRAKRPLPSRKEAGRRLEIYRDRGVLLLVDGRETLRVIHTSTGAFGRTPAGSYRVFRKERMSWSVPFKVWMPYAAYFVGGIATHEYPDVPSYPASHGCIRLPAGEAERVYRFADIGTRVLVF